MSRTKGQITFEFLILIIFTVLILVIYVPVAWQQQADIHANRERAAATLAATKIKQEVDLAIRFGSGYKRNFSLPALEYEANIIPESRLLFIKWREGLITRKLLTDRVCNETVYSPSSFAEFGGFKYTKALWHFDEGSGQLIGDSACFYRSNGTLGATLAEETTDPTWRAGKHNWALDFNEAGIYEYVTVPVADGDILDISGSLAIEAWIKPDTIDGARSIVDRIYNYALWIRNGRVVFTVGSVSTQDVIEIESATTVPVNNWTHVVGVYDHAAGILKIFINGELDNERPGSFNNWVANNNELLIGNGNVVGSMASQFSGLIDEVRISTPDPVAIKIKNDVKIWNEENYIIISEAI